MLDESLVGFVLTSLPPPPLRVLEVGAGAGELAAQLSSCGYDVVAIDPATRSPDVQALPLLELDRPEASFDAALAVLSLHHVEPLDESCRHLGALVRPGGALVIDEFDVARLDVVAAGWWSDHRATVHGEDADPEAVVAELREHLHPLDRVLSALDPWFEFSQAKRGPYLYRWQLGADLRSAEEREIDRGRLPATGARVVGRRR